MKKKYSFIAITFLLVAASSVMAVEKTSLDFITTNSQTSKEANLAKKQWHIDDVEWGRYKELMRGIRGSLSADNISPIEVLGIHARDPQERKKYALKWAQLMREDTERVLKFQFAYDDAANALAGSQQMINMALLNERRKKVAKPPTENLKPGDRVLLFVKYNNCPMCESKLRNVLAQIKDVKNVQLDIYFIDTTKGKDDKKLRDWSKRNGIDRQSLYKKKITLNHDKKLINKYFGFTTDVPITAILRQNKLVRI